MSNPATGKILQYLDAFTQEVKTAFPKIKDIDTHAGRLSENDIKQLLLKAPALRLALLGSKRVESRLEGTSAIACQFGCFIITKNGTKLSKDRQATNIGEALMVKFDRFQPKSTDTNKLLGRPAQNLRFDILISSGQKKSGVMLCAVAWESVITCGEGIFEEGGPVLDQLYINGDLVMGNAP